MKSRTATRAAWIAAGLALTGVGVVGAFVPLLPSTIFGILAAGCFARSSPRLESWLLRQPRLGPNIRAWRRERAIPTGAKVVAIASMALSAAILVGSAPPAASAAGLVVLAGCAAYVSSRPTPSLTARRPRRRRRRLARRSSLLRRARARSRAA